MAPQLLCSALEVGVASADHAERTLTAYFEPNRNLGWEPVAENSAELRRRRERGALGEREPLPA